MRNFLVLLVIVFWTLNILPARAVYDPLSVPNNRYGVHILDPVEIEAAAKLVNSAGGDWGYVTVPIRSNDRHPAKWTKFMQDCSRLHLIPILRLATYPAGTIWVAPTLFDLIDYANFLDTLPWPVKNRYVIVFNEPNHAKEWGNRVSPLEYASLLIDAHRIFKDVSSDFFLLTAGLDMSAPNSASTMDALKFYRLMTLFQPLWPAAVDGLSVHVYSPSTAGITSYQPELKLLQSLGLAHRLPIFITETASPSFTRPFTAYWTEPDIVAITPFLLFAGAGAFQPFSLLDPGLLPTSSYWEIYSLPKVPGSPLLSSINIQPSDHKTITVGQTPIQVEIAATDASRAMGLSGRDSLPENRGLLFIYPRPDRYSFWMKDMKFSLDFIWMNANRVVQLTPAVPPPSQTAGLPKIITPRQPVDQVLEVNNGFIQKHGIKVGDAMVARF